MSTRDTSGMKSFTVRVPEEIAKRMTIAAAYEGKSREQWIREALELVLRRVEERREGA